MSQSYWDNYNRKIYNKEIMTTSLEHDRFLYDYDREMVSLRFKILEKYCKDKKVVDFGCGTGSYLIPIAEIAKEIVGIDFSEKMLNILKSKIKRGNCNNTKVYQENLKNTSLKDKYVDVVFSIATLYYISEVEMVIFEMNRILKKRGIAIFEMGNLWSLNTLTTHHAFTGVKSFHISLNKMKKIIKQANFKILEHRIFQLSPMYGGPFYLRLLVDSRWKLIMGKKIKERMLDEIISSFFPFKYFAFRHLFICQKEENL